MTILNIDPWNDDLGKRWKQARETVMAMRGVNEVESSHFPARDERLQK